MRMELKHMLCGFILLVFVTICTQADEKTSRDVKRSTDEIVEDAMVAALPEDEDDKRIFRYGRGSLLRYGRGSLFRYGKRGSLFRYGKRNDDEAYNDMLSNLMDNYDNEVEKRLFRYGKRDNYAIKRLFRYGKRSDEEPIGEFSDDLLDADEKRVFRYGKRHYEYDPMKRRVFRFGKRDQDNDVMFKYGRDTRIPSGEPHVPFRFGDEE